jgi:chaperonin GroES
MKELETTLKIDQELIDAPNLVDRFTESDLVTIGSEVFDGYTRDKGSRAKWEDRNNAGMDLALQIQEEKNWPWTGCSNVVFPLVTIAALQFSARSYSNIIQGTNVVRYRTIGKADAQAIERAGRIGKHMSWQVLEEDSAWEEQMDRLLINLSIVGCNFKKTYWDSEKGYIVSELVMARDLIIDYYAKSVEDAARKTHRVPLSRNEVYTNCARDIFVDVRNEDWFKRPPAPRSTDPNSNRRRGQMPPQPDQKTPYYFLEQHTKFDFDKDGYEEPYIVTIEEKSHKVVRITSRIEQMKDVLMKDGEIISITPQEYFTKYSFIPSPDGGIYDLGFGVFLGPINDTVNSAINQLIDSGTMMTSIGGFLGRGVKIRGGVYTMAPWEWKRTDSTGQDLKNNIVPFPDRQPSTVLFQLIGLLIDYSNRIAGTNDTTMGENPGQNTPAYNYVGMTEQGLQLYSMLFKRIWRCMKGEFKMRYRLNGIYLPAEMQFGSGHDMIRQEDYRGSPDQIAPVADPKISSVLLRVQQVVAIKQSAATTPGYDMPLLEHKFLEAIEVDGIDQIFPGPGKVPKGHEMTNPIVQREMMKLQAVQMKEQGQKIKWANELLEERRVNDAKIRLYEAQALKAASDANVAGAAQVIEGYNALIEHHKAYSEMVDKRIKALLDGGNDGEGQDSDEGGVRRLEGPSSDEDDSSVSVSVPGGSKVSVGSGGVSRSGRGENGAG